MAKNEFNKKDFEVSLEDVKKLLKKYNLLRSSDFYRKPVSRPFPKISSKKEYAEAYSKALEKFNYHF